MEPLFNSIGKLFFILALPFYLSIFAFDYIGSVQLQGITPFALYFANFTGSALIFTALVFFSVAKYGQVTKENIAKSGVKLFVLMAITRFFVLLNAQAFFPFFSELFAQGLMLAEVLTLSFLAKSLWKKQQ